VQGHATGHTRAHTNVEVDVRYAIALDTRAAEPLTNGRALLLGEPRCTITIPIGAIAPRITILAAITIGLTLTPAVTPLALILPGAGTFLILTAIACPLAVVFVPTAVARALAIVLVAGAITRTLAVILAIA
jgi:hypothetical protein